MAKINLSSPEWCDLVFADRNHAYGAYQMREKSPRRHNIAVLMVIVIALIGFSIPALVRLATPKEKEVMTEVTTLSRLDEPEVKQEEMKRVEPLAPPPPALKSSIKFTAPVIKKDEEVKDDDEIKTQDELTKTKVTISIADVKGNDEVHGQDIADVKQVVTQAPTEKVFDRVEQMPTYPGGIPALYEWISKNMHYPTMAQEYGVQGRVVCQFVIGADGSIRDIKVVRSLDPSCDKEAVRMLKEMPKWIPGKQNGQAVSVKYTLPIVFKLQS
jgi:protein TonB